MTGWQVAAVVGALAAGYVAALLGLGVTIGRALRDAEPPQPRHLHLIEGEQR